MRFLLSTIFLVLFGCAQAGAVGIKMSGNQDPNCQVQYICVTDSSFLITTNDVGGGYFEALNQQGAPITSLNFDLDYLDAGCATGGPEAVDLSFASDFLPFASQNLAVKSSSSCTGTSTPQGVPIAEYLLSLNFGPGVPNSFLFEIDLSNAGNGDPNAPGGWLPSTTFTVTTATPEPVSYALAAFGLILLWASRSLLRKSVFRD